MNHNNSLRKTKQKWEEIYINFRKQSRPGLGPWWLIFPNRNLLLVMKLYSRMATVVHDGGNDLVPNQMTKLSRIKKI